MDDVMGKLAAAFLARLRDRLEAPYGGNVEAGHAAERLAREFRGGLPGMIAWLERERAHPSTPGGGLTVAAQLLESWVKPGDERDLKLATGWGRDEWLGVRL